MIEQFINEILTEANLSAEDAKKVGTAISKRMYRIKTGGIVTDAYLRELGIEAKDFRRKDILTSLTQQLFDKGMIEYSEQRGFEEPGVQFTYTINLLLPRGSTNVTKD